jgi:hypothetical protein
MCLILGRENLNRNRFAAYCYFTQGRMFMSDYWEKIGLELVNLCIGNASEVIRIGIQCWEKSENLSLAEQKWLCRHLIHAFKRKGDSKNAYRFFQEYTRITGKNN